MTLKEEMASVPMVIAEYGDRRIRNAQNGKMRRMKLVLSRSKAIAENEMRRMVKISLSSFSKFVKILNSMRRSFCNIFRAP